MYTHDIMFIGEWFVINFLNLKRVLRCFYLTSKLKAIFFKIAKPFAFGVENTKMSRIANLLNCEADTLPFSNLCVLIGANMKYS